MNGRGVAAAMAFGLGLFSLAASGCGAGGGESRATLTIALTDAKPSLPDGVEAVVVTVDAVSVHRADGEGVSLPLARNPYVVDLLQFHSGTTTRLVPPTELEPGTYTQLRLGVAKAVLRVNGEEFSIPVPSEKIRTDRNFSLADGGAVALTVDFDLSQSIVDKGDGQYHLKPVLHLVETAEAASITGAIDAAAFGPASGAEVAVTRDVDGDGIGDEAYTRRTVSKPAPGTDAAPFEVFWLMPNADYVVQVHVSGVEIYAEAVGAEDLEPGSVFLLHGGLPIPPLSP